MRDIVGRYGFHPNHSGFIPCPFHKEKTASMKIYSDSYYCFGCGEHGDIFSFIMNMENQPFSETWTDCYHALQYQLYLHEILNQQEGQRSAE